jgi:hypothetical protein
MKTVRRIFGSLGGVAGSQQVKTKAGEMEDGRCVGFARGES